MERIVTKISPEQDREELEEARGLVRALMTDDLTQFFECSRAHYIRHLRGWWLSMQDGVLLRSAVPECLDRPSGEWRKPSEDQMRQYYNKIGKGGDR